MKPTNLDVIDQPRVTSHSLLRPLRNIKIYFSTCIYTRLQSYDEYKQQPFKYLSKYPAEKKTAFAG